MSPHAVILSAAKDLFASLGLAARQEILRFAQDDKAVRTKEVVH
jgi:hypothetical protein